MQNNLKYVLLLIGIYPHIVSVESGILSVFVFVLDHIIRNRINSVYLEY